MEIKFALNRDIADIAGQIDRYYQIITADPELIASEAETLLQQKLELGLFGLDQNRLDVMKTLTISRDINHYQFILVLVDYNPYSQLFDSQKLAALPFAKQIKVFCGGFALWEKELVSISQTSKNIQKDLS